MGEELMVHLLIGSLVHWFIGSHFKFQTAIHNPFLLKVFKEIQIPTFFITLPSDF